MLDLPFTVRRRSWASGSGSARRSRSVPLMSAGDVNRSAAFERRQDRAHATAVETRRVTREPRTSTSSRFVTATCAAERVELHQVTLGGELTRGMTAAMRFETCERELGIMRQYRARVLEERELGSE